MRVAVVGCNIGKAQVAAFRTLPAQFDVVAVCDSNLPRAQEVAAEFNVREAVADYGQLCRRSDVEIVSLCTPPPMHREHILMALQNGKRVICEKPLVGSLAEVDELAAAETRHRLPIMPIFQGRFGHGLQKLKRLVDRGIAGPAYLSTVETAWNRGPEYYATAWRTSWKGAMGGCLLQQAIHAHDALTFIVGPARSVFTRATTRVNPVETEDCAAAAVEMKDGSLATFAVTLGSTEEITRHRFCFKNLTAESNTSAYGNSKDPWRFIGRDASIDRLIEAELASFVPEPEGYAGQFFRYHRALASGGPLPVTLEDARMSLELVTALYYAVETGVPAALPITSQHPRYSGWRPILAA